MTRSLLGIRYLAVFDSVLYFSHKNLIEKSCSSYFHIEDNNSYFLRFYNYILDESSFQNFLLKYKLWSDNKLNKMGRKMICDVFTH